MLVVKNLPAKARDIKDMGSLPGLGRSGGGHGNPLVSLPAESHRQRSLEGYSPWDHKESNTTEAIYHASSSHHLILTSDTTITQALIGSIMEITTL